MKITGIRTFHLRYSMPYPLTYARGEYDTREALLVKVETDDSGVFGWGEAAMWGGPHIVTATVIEREIAPILLGEHPCQPDERVRRHRATGTAGPDVAGIHTTLRSLRFDEPRS